MKESWITYYRAGLTYLLRTYACNIIYMSVHITYSYALLLAQIASQKTKIRLPPTRTLPLTRPNFLGFGLLIDRYHI